LRLRAREPHDLPHADPANDRQLLSGSMVECARPAPEMNWCSHAEEQVLVAPTGALLLCAARNEQEPL